MCVFPAKGSALLVSLREAAIPNPGRRGTPGGASGVWRWRAWGSPLQLPIAAPQGGLGFALPGIRRAPRGRASAGSAGAGPGPEETSGGRPALFLFCTCCSIRESESVRSVEFALFIRGMTVSPPESLWLPSRVQRVFRKGQIAWLLPLWSELGLDSLVS